MVSAAELLAQNLNFGAHEAREKLRSRINYTILVMTAAVLIKHIPLPIDERSARLVQASLLQFDVISAIDAIFGYPLQQGRLGGIIFVSLVLLMVLVGAVASLVRLSKRYATIAKYGRVTTAVGLATCSVLLMFLVVRVTAAGWLLTWTETVILAAVIACGTLAAQAFLYVDRQFGLNIGLALFVFPNNLSPITQTPLYRAIMDASKESPLAVFVLSAVAVLTLLASVYMCTIYIERRDKPKSNAGAARYALAATSYRLFLHGKVPEIAMASVILYLGAKGIIGSRAESYVFMQTEATVLVEALGLCVLVFVCLGLYHYTRGYEVFVRRNDIWLGVETQVALKPSEKIVFFLLKGAGIIVVVLPVFVLQHVFKETSPSELALGIIVFSLVLSFWTLLTALVVEFRLIEIEEQYSSRDWLLRKRWFRKRVPD